MRRALSMLLAIVAMLAPAASAIAAPMRDAGRVELGAENGVKAILPSGVVEAEGHTLFLQRDPNGYQDSVNQYAYGANDPINHRDPTGRDACGPSDSALSWMSLSEWREQSEAGQRACAAAAGPNVLVLALSILPPALLAALPAALVGTSGGDAESAAAVLAGVGVGAAGGAAARALGFGRGISSAVDEAFASYGREASGPGFWAAEALATPAAAPLKNLSGSVEDASAKARSVYPGAPRPPPPIEPEAVELHATRHGDRITVATADGRSYIQGQMLENQENALWVSVVNNAVAHKQAGYTSIRLYEALINEAGNVSSVEGSMMFDNFKAISRAGGDIMAAPRTKVLHKLGFTEHSYDPSTRRAVARKP